jgi:hypothetical protein
VADDPGIVATPVEPEPAEYTWVPLARWPSEMVALRNDIREADEVLPLLEGMADDLACRTATDFVREMRAAGKAELAMRLLQLHGVELPAAGDFKTPQAQMSENLKKTADTIRQQRADITPADVGMKVPPPSRARRQPSQYGGGLGPLGSLGRD